MLNTITKIEITHHQLPLDPPFPASWDTQPRTKFPATIVRVHDSAGNVGIGSGDAMYGFGDYRPYSIGQGRPAWNSMLLSTALCRLRSSGSCPMK